jgi:hypothetical protein
VDDAMCEEDEDDDEMKKRSDKVQYTHVNSVHISTPRHAPTAPVCAATPSICSDRPPHDTSISSSTSSFTHDVVRSTFLLVRAGVRRA